MLREAAAALRACALRSNVAEADPKLSLPLPGCSLVGVVALTSLILR